MNRLISIILTLFITLPLGLTAAKAVTLDEMIGQMVLVGFEGKDINSSSAKALAKDIANKKVGGILFLSRNIGTAKQITALTKAFQSASSDKTLITIDQEGGKVRRLREAQDVPFLPSAKQMTKVSQNIAYEKYYETALYIKNFGFNVNFGPVVDLEVNKSNPIIAKLERSYGNDIKQVSEYAYMFVAGHKQAGILTALKHFPGHGSSAADTHKGFTNISKTWNERELEPYRNLINWQAADIVMSAHVYLDIMSDKDRVPTSLSYKAITQILRKQLGFKGVVVSDDMAMGAISKNYTSKTAIIKAVNAGTDLIMLSSQKNINTSLGSWVHSIIKTAVKNGEIDQQTIINAYNRIQILKQKIQ